MNNGAVEARHKVKPMKIRKDSITLALLLVLGTGVWGGAPSGKKPEYGPAKGTLVIVGGGPTKDTGIMEKFIELAGGPKAKFVIVPTAGGNKTPDGKFRVFQEEKVLAGWKSRGLTNLRMLHT